MRRIELGYDMGALQTTGAAVAVSIFRPGPARPGPNRAVLVVAAGDVAAVEARLRPQLGESLCVVPSRWTKALSGLFIEIMTVGCRDDL